MPSGVCVFSQAFEFVFFNAASSLVFCFFGEEPVTSLDKCRVELRWFSVLQFLRLLQFLCEFCSFRDLCSFNSFCSLAVGFAVI
jgi:hypothetical protein